MIIHQPICIALGLHLIEKLQSGNFDTFRFIAAYAKTSGVNRLLPYMRAFKESGGRILGIVGIDQKITSYEALMSLQDTCDALYIYHSESFTKTFHVKGYNLEGKENCWTAIGSHNFTAGGLFSNYEACMTTSLPSPNREFAAMFSDYSDTGSSCCRAVTPELVQALFDNHYIRKESELVKELISDRAKQKRTPQKEVLFEYVPAALPKKTAAAKPSVTVSVTIPYTDSNEYLIRHVPKAGVRSKQVHFTLDILHEYFKKKQGDTLQLQQIDDIYNPRCIENRSIIYSRSNKNVKIEVGAAAALDKSYPTNPDTRPILLFRRINTSFYEYMLLMDGDPGYTILNQRLLSLRWSRRSLPYEYVDADTMLSLWPDCPLV